MNQKTRSFFKKTENKEKKSSSVLLRRVTHGGELARGKRKSRRPLSLKKPMHLVMKSSKAVNACSFDRAENQQKIQTILQKQSKKHGIKILKFVSEKNAIQLLIRANSRIGFQHFLRTCTALLARALTGAKKGSPFGKFWDSLTFSRILKTALEFSFIKNVIGNTQLSKQQKSFWEKMALYQENLWEKIVALQKLGLS